MADGKEMQRKGNDIQNINTNKDSINENFKIPKEDIFKSYQGYTLFKDSIQKDINYKKNEILEILQKVDELELQMYLDGNMESKNLIDLNITDFITNFKGLIEPRKIKKESGDILLGENEISKKDKSNAIDKQTVEKDKQTVEKDKQKTGIDLLAKNDSKYRELFKGDATIIKILDDIEVNKKDPTKVASLLNEFLSNKENATKFFDTIAKSGDKELYKETISSFQNLGVTIPAHISPVIYKVEKLNDNTTETKSLISQFPGAKGEDIEKRGDLVSYGDKTIDLKTGKAYISGEKGYAIETIMQVPNSLELRVKYQTERLEILEDIQTNEKFKTLVENKMNLTGNLEKLKTQKSTDRKNQNDLELDSQMNLIEKELKKIDEKLKNTIPGYNPEQDEAFIKFLEHKIEKSTEKLQSLKEKFDTDIQELLGKGKDEITQRDNKKRETITFLDNLGITNIHQNDLQKIINRININPQAFGFLKKIDLKNGFEGSPTDALKTKKELFNLFSKVYKKMGFNPPVKENVVEGFTKDERLKDDTIFKQKLEDNGMTKGGSLQIETFMKIIKEEEQKK